jgi:hypothetical protein
MHFCYNGYCTFCSVEVLLQSVHHQKCHSPVLACPTSVWNLSGSTSRRETGEKVEATVVPRGMVAWLPPKNDPIITFIVVSIGIKYKIVYHWLKHPCLWHFHGQSSFCTFEKQTSDCISVGVILKGCKMVDKLSFLHPLQQPTHKTYQPTYCFQCFWKLLIIFYQNIVETVKSEILVLARAPQLTVQLAHGG